MRLLLESTILAFLTLAIWPLLRVIPISNKHLVFVGWAAFIAAAFVLQDFARRSVDMPPNLGDAYGVALKHTLLHVVWIFAVNAFFILAFSAFLKQYGSAPLAMVCWLTAAMVVPILVDYKNLRNISIDKWLAFACLGAGIYFLWRDSSAKT